MTAGGLSISTDGREQIGCGGSSGIRFSGGAGRLLVLLFFLLGGLFFLHRLGRLLLFAFL
jgi:hypothetical protein